MRKRKNLPNTKSQKQSSKTLQVALLFVTVVGFLIGFSLLVKIGILISKSKFDGLHQFVIQVEGHDHTAAIIFSPDTHKITVLTLVGSTATASLTKSLQLPVDATVQDDSFGSSPDDFIHRALISGWGKSTLNQLDKLKLILFSQTVASDDITTKQLSLSPSDLSFDNTLTSLATDQTLYKEAQTIAVVNGSGISGVGNTVAKLLTHVGANVISVTTADKEETTSSIVYTGDKTYTVQRLSHIFSIEPINTTTASIADITVTIGKDKGDTFSSQ